MIELVDTLQRLYDLTGAALYTAERLYLSTSSPARQSGLNLISLYLMSVRAGIEAALSLAKRL
jgi:hypothetical protein